MQRADLIARLSSAAHWALVDGRFDDAYLYCGILSDINDVSDSYLRDFSPESIRACIATNCSNREFPFEHIASLLKTLEHEQWLFADPTTDREKYILEKLVELIAYSFEAGDKQDFLHRAASELKRSYHYKDNPDIAKARTRLIGIVSEMFNLSI